MAVHVDFCIEGWWVSFGYIAGNRVAVMESLSFVTCRAFGALQTSGVASWGLERALLICVYLLTYIVLYSLKREVVALQR